MSKINISATTYCFSLLYLVNLLIVKWQGELMLPNAQFCSAICVHYWSSLNLIYFIIQFNFLWNLSNCLASYYLNNIVLLVHINIYIRVISNYFMLLSMCIVSLGLSAPALHFAWVKKKHAFIACCKRSCEYELTAVLL